MFSLFFLIPGTLVLAFCCVLLSLSLGLKEFPFTGVRGGLLKEPLLLFEAGFFNSDPIEVSGVLGSEPMEVPGVPGSEPMGVLSETGVLGSEPMGVPVIMGVLGSESIALFGRGLPISSSLS